MKNIETILADAGLELSDEQKSAITSAVNENYKTIADYQKQVEKAKSKSDTITELQEQLKAFDGVDAEALNSKIKELTDTITSKEEEYKTNLADRDFKDALSKAIGKHKGLNEKAIIALLDTESLKKSQNQNDDIEKALTSLSEAEDSKMLFGSTESVLGKGSPIGAVKDSNDNSGDALLRQAMGLPPIQNKE